MNMNNMAMVNVNNLLNIKDSRWLQLEVCREFQRNKCTRPDTECKFAHPPPNVEVQNGRVTACYDSIKGRCNREKPPCKYFHPPLHLKDQLLINGRNHLALKNALMQQMGLAPGQAVVPGQVPPVAANPYLGVTGQGYNPYFATGPLVPLVTSDPSGGVSPLGVPQQTVLQQKVSRGDRLDVSQSLWANNNIHYGYCIEESYPGMVTYKRPADKSGVYQPANNPSAAAYQQLMQLQQPFVPVSSTVPQAAVSAASAITSGGVPISSSTQDQQQTNGTLDSNALGNDVKRERMPDSSDENNDVDGNNLGGGVNNSNNEVDEDVKESSVKRMRTANNAAGNGLSPAVGGALSNNAAVIAQNNSAYAAAAQSYHNALAAINYTGAPLALQANKNPQPPPNPASYPGANPLQGSIQAGGIPQQQQQFLAQYQAMLTAFATNPAALQGQFNAQAAANAAVGQQQQQQQQQSFQQSIAASQGQLNPAFAAVAAMNPLLAASFPQLAAQQRANMMASHQQGGAAAAALQSAQLNQLAAAGIPTSNLQFNHLMGMQFANQAAAAAGGLPLQQNQQALLAAYGQIGRGPMPVVTGAQTMGSQQLFNPAAAAAAALASNGGLQGGVKRMRPT
ncbi:polyglutamine-repeat protein pqn-41 isoform X2 [Folsomia candida]|uniref:polyglutamine-repeat protein pqn-41 isoform X2 n=1 Tax=Folsomia candida TaxID=158441 RepID=UPI000B8EF9B8|nr:polyglutamine-repeat protein pqn-41 isoform X2 [Folsomia candida]